MRLVSEEIMQLEVKTERGIFSVHRTGSGPRNIVCLHPLALAGGLWDRFAGSLGEGCTVWALDARGHGQSSWDGEPYVIEDMAADVAAVMTELGIGPAGVAGMSMGGCAALALALDFPECVDRLALVDTTSDYGPDREAKWEARAKSAASKPRSDQIPFQLDRWFSEGFRADDPGEVQRIVDIFLATDSNAHAAACRALGQFSRTADLGKVSVPTIVIVGEEDQATPVSMAEVLAENINGARLEVVPQARHFNAVESPATWKLLADHLAPEVK